MKFNYGKILKYAIITMLSLSTVFNATITMADTATDDIKQSWKRNIPDDIWQIQVYVNESDKFFLLPSYANVRDIKSMVPWCSVYDSWIWYPSNLPNGSTRITCDTTQHWTDLLKKVDILNSHTTYGSALPDLYIPKYYIVETEYKLPALNASNLSIDIPTGKIWFNWPSSMPLSVAIFDPDTGSNAASRSAWTTVFENSTYVQDAWTPNLAVEVFWLDGDRLSNESLSLGAYSLEHYLTSDQITKTYDSNELWGTTNSLKYVLNYYEWRMSEKVFREVCNDPKTAVYKNDTFLSSISSIKTRNFLDSTQSTRVWSVDAWECNSVSWLRSTNPVGNAVNYVAPNGSMKIGYDMYTAPASLIQRSTSLSTDANYAGWQTYLLNVDKSDKNGEFLSVTIPLTWVIWNTRQYSDTSFSNIVSKLQGKSVKFYYMMKMTSYYPGKPDDWNKYTAGLDPMNPYYYTYTNHSTEAQKYLYANHVNGWGTRTGAGDANYYIVLWKREWLLMSSIYMLSAPAYTEKATRIKSWADVNATNVRMRNMNLNISQWFMASEENTRTSEVWQLNLMSFVKLYANETWKTTPSIVFRNYDADMQNPPTSFATNNDMEQNLDYLVGYLSPNTELNIAWALNSANLSWLLWVGNSSAYYYNWTNQDLKDRNSFSCLPSFFEPITFKNGIVGITSDCNTYNGLLASYQTISWPYTYGTNYYQQYQLAIQNLSDWENGESEWLLTQIIWNVKDTDVYNQIYANTNVPIWVAHSEPISCKINLFKVPVVAWLNYSTLLSAESDLSTNPSYSWSANVFRASKASYVDTATFDSLFWKTKNTTKEKSYYSTQYAWSTKDTQKWLLWERWFVTYECLKTIDDSTNTNFEEIDVHVSTSDEKYTRDAGWNFIKIANTNKLSSPLFTFNTGSWLWVRRTMAWDDEVGKLGWVDWPFKTTGYINSSTSWGYNYTTLNNAWNTVATNDFYLWLTRSRAWLVRGGIEMQIASNTNNGEYGRIDIAIYDKNRPGRILDTKTYYISAKNKAWVTISADGKTAKWSDNVARSVINHTDGITFTIQNNGTTTLNASDATTWLNAYIYSLFATKKVSNAIISTTGGGTTGAIAACTAQGVDCWTLTWYTPTANGTKTYSQDGSAYFDWVVWASNTASPKIKIEIKNSAGTVLKSAIVNQWTKHATSIAYSLGTLWSPATEKALRIIFPWDYQKLMPGDKIEITLAASTNAFSAINWMQPWELTEQNQATAFAVYLADGNTLVPWTTYQNYKPVITKTISPMSGCTVANVAFPSTYTWTWNGVFSSGDGKQLYLSETALRAATWNSSATCWVQWECVFRLTPVVYAWTIAEWAGYSMPTALWSVPQSWAYNFFIQLQQRYRALWSPVGYQFSATNNSPLLFNTYPLKGDLRFVFWWVDSITKNKIVKFTQDRTKAIWISQASTANSYTYSSIGSPTLTWLSQAGLVSWSPNTLSTFKYYKFCDGVSASCWASVWPGDINNSIFYGVKGTSNGSPMASAYVTFSNDASNVVNTIDLRNQTCLLWTVAFPTAPALTPAHWTCAVISQEVPNGSNNINSCDPSASWLATANGISLEEDLIPWNYVKYNLQCGNDGDMDFDGDLEFLIDNYGTYASSASYSISNGWSPTVSSTSNSVKLSGITIPWQSTSNVSLTVNLAPRTPSCPETTWLMNARAKLTSSSYQSDLPMTTNTVAFKECKVPTLTLNGVRATDGNVNNDKIQDSYTSAYPFEFTQCSNSVRYEIDWKYECFDQNPDAGKLSVKFYPGATTDGKWTWRNFINTWNWGSLYGINPVITGKTSAIWTTTAYTTNFSSSPSGNFSPSITVNPTTWGDLRMLWSKFRVSSSIGSSIPKIKSPSGSFVLTAWEWISSDLNSQIGLDPTVAGQKIYDNGIYSDSDVNTVKLHKEEIDWSSKKLTKTGTWYYEPVVFEAKVDNPLKNQSTYGMTALRFDMSLNPSSLSYFDKVDTSVSSSGSEITVKAGEPMWQNQNLAAGGSISYRGGFNLIPTLKTPNLTPANALYQTSGTPTLKFANDQWMACNFNTWFNPWTSEVLKNPITLTSVSFADDPTSITPSTDEISWLPFEQHLPWDIMNISAAFSNNNSTRDFAWTFVKFTFDATWSGKIDDPAFNFDFDKVFIVQGASAAWWVTLNDGSAKCQTTATTLKCELLSNLDHTATKTLKIPLIINVESNFYKQLKLQPNTKNWKYWYPTVISKIEYGTPDLNLINNVVYYTSADTQLPSWGIRDDIETMDFNDPTNRTIPAEPLDWKYSFYIWMPYSTISTTFQNASVGNISPGDIVVYKTKITNIGKASLKNPNMTQDAFPLWLKDNWVDTEINKIIFTPKLNKTNVWPEVTVNFKALNSDADTTNDANVKNIGTIMFKEGINVKNYTLVAGSRVEAIANKDIVLIDGSNSLTDGWDVELTTEMKIVKLKDAEMPQIDCKTAWACVRAWKNPKNEELRGKLDLPFVGDPVDESENKTYSVHFPILKSQLFAKSWIDYRYAAWTNSDIKGMLNSDNTTVTYRLDNFVPQDYTNHTTEKVGKARNVKTYVRLPMWVKYVPSSVKKVENIVDWVSDPLYNTLSAVAPDPVITEHSDYGTINWASTNSFDNTFLTNANWNKIPWSNDSNFQYMKGTPFKFNYFNQNYNYYRITDDASLALGYAVDPTNPTNLNESAYYTAKKTWTLHTIGSTLVSFDRMKQGVILPNATRYTNEKWEYKYSDGITPITIGVGSSILLNAWATVSFSEGLEGVSYSWSTVDIFKSNVDYDITATPWKTYAMISPAFIKLDLTKKPEHGVYERVVTDWAWKVIEVRYQWFGYVEWTTKEVKLWVILYNGTQYNNVKFVYWSVDNTLTMPIVSGISSWKWNVLWTFKFWTYNGLQLRNLDNKDDVSFDASPANVYQELVFNSWYPADAADAVADPVLMYQEKSASGAYVKWPGKDQTSYIFQFNVRITTTDLVCGSEYSTSDGWNTLSWWNIASARSDKDDIDKFCFSSVKPTIKILDNGSYARGWYKTDNANNCTVNHLSLMWFNARAIWWNKSALSAGCWLTYNIQSVEKDLSMNTISPYDLLAKFKEKTDTRPIDTSLTMNDKKITFTLAKDIKVKTSTGTLIDVNTIYPWFQTSWFKILAKNVFYVYGNASGNGYVLRSSDEGNSYDVIYTAVGRTISKAFLSDMVNLVFFSDGKYVRDTNGGSGPWSVPMTLVDYNGINDIWFISNTYWFVLGNNGIIWKTQDGWQSFTKVNLKTTNNLGLGENLTSIDTYGGKDVWISTSLWNVLYSSNWWSLFTKKTSGASVDTSIMTFEDGTQTLKNITRTPIVGTQMSWVDNVDNGSSIKFDNLNNVLVWTGQKSITWIVPAWGKMLAYNGSTVINLSPYITTWFVNADLYIDIYVSNKAKTGDISELSIKDWSLTTNLYITNPAQFNLDGSNELKTGWNKLKVPLRNANTSWKWLQNGSNWANMTRVELWTPASAWIDLQWEHFIVSNIRLAPITNLSNIQTVYLFPQGNVSKATTNNNILEMDGTTNTSNRFSLAAFKKSDNTLEWYITLDMFVSDNTAEFPSSLFVGNSNGNGIKWNNLSLYVKGGTIKNGWNTLVLPFNNVGDANIVYTNRYDINWWSLDTFRMAVTNNVQTKFVLFAMDNLIYSATANTSFNFIRFFNTGEWVAFDQNKTYITYDNITWWNNEVHNEPWLNFINMVKLKWREIYGVGNATGGWVSYYSLDKGRNSKKFLSTSWISFKAFDAYDYDYGFAVSSTNKLYRMELIPN